MFPWSPQISICLNILSLVLKSHFHLMMQKSFSPSLEIPSSTVQTLFKSPNSKDLSKIGGKCLNCAHHKAKSNDILPLQNCRVNVPILKVKHRITANKDWTQVIWYLAGQISNLKLHVWHCGFLTNLLCSKGLEQPLCRKLAPLCLKLSMVLASPTS